MIHNKTKLIFLLAIAAILISPLSVRAHWLMPIISYCNYTSLTDPECKYCENVENFNRDWPMGAASAPSLDDIWIERQYPHPDEKITVRIKAATNGAGNDNLPNGAQRLLWAEMAYTLNDGRTWYMNNYDDTRLGTGISMDFFTREVLVVKNKGNIRYKWYISEEKPWALSPVSSAYNPEGDRPAPNRRCPWSEEFCGAELRSLYIYPHDYDCPWGLMCETKDTWPPNTGVNIGLAGEPGWPDPWCSKGDGEGLCNVEGFPEGGGDILDAFPLLDPFPFDRYPNVTGHPLVRVNGIPGIDCDIYNGENNTLKKLHPMCDNPTDEVKAVYEEFGIKTYKISPLDGMVRFTNALTPVDVVDATFYSMGMRVWTANIDLKQEPFNTFANHIGGGFRMFPKVYDTCGNMASGSTVPPYPSSGSDLTDAYIGIKDFYFDRIPIDQDPTVQENADAISTQCSATDDWCPATFPKTREQLYDNGTGGCNDPGCECCFNECKYLDDGAVVSNTWCEYLGDYDTMCHDVGDDGNPPGCGPEFGSDGGFLNAQKPHMDHAEIREFKISHSEADIYLKMETTGEMTWGCYGSWYPLIGCEYTFGEMGSKFAGYAWQMVNVDSNSTFYLVVVADVPVYGSLSLWADINSLLSGGLANAYDGEELEQYADGSDCRTAFPCGVEEPPGPSDCEKLGCAEDPCDADPLGDCDEDGYLNCDDACPCKNGGSESEDGCKPPDPETGDDFSAYSCGSCQVTVDGNEMFLTMSREDTIGSTGDAPIHALGLDLTLHDFDIDCLLYFVCLKNFNMTALAQDSTPRLNYYSTGKLANFDVEIREDYIPPETPSALELCLGRCDEANLEDGIDNDGDSDIMDPQAENRVDEGYDPTSTQVELKWREVVFNQDYLKSNIEDLGGYQIYISRDRGTKYELFYTMCTKDTASTDVNGDCYGLNPEPRDDPESDEPYWIQNRRRYPRPFDVSRPHTGYGFPGEPITCIVDVDCDLKNNLVDEDKDGSVDEGCWTPNCKDDGTALLPDGQTYWFKIRAFDLPHGSDTIYFNFSDFTAPQSVTLLKNSYKPDATDVTDAYAMNNGQQLKIVWSPNKEEDVGGYVIYRCPANPLDAVKITQDSGREGLDLYCQDDSHYRRISKTPVDRFHGYFLDSGFGFMETGVGTDTIFVDERTNWEPSVDYGVDGQAGGVMLGEGDERPSPGINGAGDLYPGEDGAYEYFDCSTLTTGTSFNEDLWYCGNLAATDTWWASATTLFGEDGEPLYTYDVTQHQNYDPLRHPPVLFYNGLVDGYTYYYKMKSVDAPYAGDGWHTIGSTADTCDYGITPYDSETQQGCVNPIVERDCDDLSIKYDWENGGNCSVLSGRMEGIPLDAQAPARPTSLSATVQNSGTAIKLDWNMSIEDRTFDHYNIYRSYIEDKKYACVHGGCDEAPYVDGCQCDPSQPVENQCKPGRTCEMPAKICTNPPFFTIETQTNGCDGDILNDGCVCTDDTECNTGRSCTYPYSICTFGEMTADDRRDNDGDGVIDEEIADGEDDDGDGLVDEDLSGSTTSSWLVGKCPDPEHPYYSHENWYSQERVQDETFTDETVQRGNTYFYRVAGVDNSVYEIFDDPDQEEFVDGNPDPPPPYEGIRSYPVVITARDTKPPVEVAGYCGTDNIRPCAGRMNAEFCPAYGGSDFYGNQISIWWARSNEEDVSGYYVYRSFSDVAEPPDSSYVRLNQTLIAQTVEGLATTTICFRDTNIENEKNYYYVVTAVDINGNESKFSEAYERPVQAADTIAPTIPVWGTSGGISSDINGLKLTITWEDHENYVPDPTSPGEIDFSHFNLYKSEEDDICEPSELLAEEITDTSYTDTNIEKDHQYYYCLTAVDTKGNESEYSDATLGVPVDMVAPDAPENLTATALDNSKIGLGWEMPEDEDLACFQVFVSTSTGENTFSMIDLLESDEGYTTVTNNVGDDVECIDDLSFIDDRARIAGINYYYKISAVDDHGNISQKSEYVSIVPVNVDTIAPPYPEDFWARAGFDLKESGSGADKDGLDNDNDGFIDDKMLQSDEIEIFWSRVTDPDVVSYEIYRLIPQKLEYCECDIVADPLGDCDNDGITNQVDEACPCTPLSPNTSQFGSYELIATKTSVSACPAADPSKTIPRPDNTLGGNICSYKDSSSSEVVLCPDCRYWYTVLAVDENGNKQQLDKTKSVAATPVNRADNTSPDAPDKPGVDPTTHAVGLVITFTELPQEDPNLDLSGYIIYRDTRPTGEFKTQVAIFNDLSNLNYCTMAGKSPCYCAEADSSKACYLDLSVVEDSRYYYKISAFDVNGNESEKSSWNYGIPNPEAPDKVGAFCARSSKSERNSLFLSWSGANLLEDSGIAGFLLYKSSTTSGDNWQVIDPDTSTTSVEKMRTLAYTDTNLIAGKTYCYMIITVSTDGAESAGVTTCGVPGEDLTPPSRPTGLIAIPSNRSIKLTWNESIEAIAYNVYRSGQKNSDYTKINTATVTVPIYTDTNLTNGQGYWYCVTSIDNEIRTSNNTCYPNIPNESECSSPVSTVPSDLTSTSVSRLMLPLEKGWNLIALPQSTSEKTATVETDESDDQPLWTMGRDAAKYSYSTTDTGSSIEISGATGMWKYSAESGSTLLYEGTINIDPIQDISLHEGWNLVGNPFIETIYWHKNNVKISTDGTSFIDLDQAVSEGIVKKAFRFNAAEQNYQEITYGSNIPVGTGFWIKITEALTIRLIK
ncbi:MAG TPA: hypothetical protein PLN69_04360 [bacterium]|nr:hypothetical protein [bacterium]